MTGPLKDTHSILASSSPVTGRVPDAPGVWDAVSI